MLEGEGRRGRNGDLEGERKTREGRNKALRLHFWPREIKCQRKLDPQQKRDVKVGLRIREGEGEGEGEVVEG